MLSKCRGRNGEICVLQIDATVLDEHGVIIADQERCKWLEALLARGWWAQCY